MADDIASSQTQTYETKTDLDKQTFGTPRTELEIIGRDIYRQQLPVGTVIPKGTIPERDKTYYVQYYDSEGRVWITSERNKVGVDPRSYLKPNTQYQLGTRDDDWQRFKEAQLTGEESVFYFVPTKTQQYTQIEPDALRQAQRVAEEKRVTEQDKMLKEFAQSKSFSTAQKMEALEQAGYSDVAAQNIIARYEPEKTITKEALGIVRLSPKTDAFIEAPNLTNRQQAITNLQKAGYSFDEAVVFVNQSPAWKIEQTAKASERELFLFSLAPAAQDLNIPKQTERLAVVSEKEMGFLSEIAKKAELPSDTFKPAPELLTEQTKQEFIAGKISYDDLLEKYRSSIWSKELPVVAREEAVLKLDRARLLEKQQELTAKKTEYETNVKTLQQQVSEGTIDVSIAQSQLNKQYEEIVGLQQDVELKAGFYGYQQRKFGETVFQAQKPLIEAQAVLEQYVGKIAPGEQIVLVPKGFLGDLKPLQQGQSTLSDLKVTSFISPELRALGTDAFIGGIVGTTIGTIQKAPPATAFFLSERIGDVGEVAAKYAIAQPAGTIVRGYWAITGTGSAFEEKRLAEYMEQVSLTGRPIAQIASTATGAGLAIAILSSETKEQAALNVVAGFGLAAGFAGVGKVAKALEKIKYVGGITKTVVEPITKYGVPIYFAGMAVKESEPLFKAIEERDRELVSYYSTGLASSFAGFMVGQKAFEKAVLFVRKPSISAKIEAREISGVIPTKIEKVGSFAEATSFTKADVTVTTKQRVIDLKQFLKTGKLFREENIIEKTPIQIIGKQISAVEEKKPLIEQIFGKRLVREKGTGIFTEQISEGVVTTKKGATILGTKEVLKPAAKTKGDTVVDALFKKPERVPEKDFQIRTGELYQFIESKKLVPLAKEKVYSFYGTFRQKAYEVKKDLLFKTFTGAGGKVLGIGEKPIPIKIKTIGIELVQEPAKPKMVDGVVVSEPRKGYLKPLAKVEKEKQEYFRSLIRKKELGQPIPREFEGRLQEIEKDLLTQEQKSGIVTFTKTKPKTRMTTGLLVEAAIPIIRIAQQKAFQPIQKVFFAVAPKAKQAQETKPSFTSKQIIVQKNVFEQKPTEKAIAQPKTIQIQLEKQKEKQEPTVKLKSVFIPSEKAKETEKTFIGIKQIVIPIQKPSEKAKETPITRTGFVVRQISREKQKPLQRYKMQAITIQQPRPIIKTPNFIVPEIKIPTKPRIPFGEERMQRLKKKKKFKQPFAVFVKKKGKIEKASRTPLTERAALALGQKITEETAARSFLVLPEKTLQTARELVLPSLQQERYFRSKEGLVAEKAKFAINTPGELREITYKGLLARQNKGWWNK